MFQFARNNTLGLKADGQAFREKKTGNAVINEMKSNPGQEHR